MTIEPTPELAYSTDEENFSKDFSDVLDELRDASEGVELIGQTYWVGEKVQHPASFYFKRSAERIVETAAELAYDENEHAEDFTTDVKPEAMAELQAFIDAWADKHVKVNFWTVKNVRQMQITAEDLACITPPSPEDKALHEKQQARAAAIARAKAAGLSEADIKLLSK